MAVSTPDRPQPPSITDPESSEFDAYAIRVREEDNEGLVPADVGEIDWAKRARDAYRFSTSFVDSNYRKLWEDSLRAFNNRHSGDSKYSSELYKKRSSLFRPKTRAAIRKNEAAGAAAFFSNVDRISVQALNEGEKMQRLSAAVMKELLQYRLTKSIPWFQTVIGALQDGQVQGCCAAHVYWKYQTRRGKTGDMEVLEDKPCVDLIPLENLRIDGAASWIDPVNTSPYLIHLIPMYVTDIKARMDKPDPKGRRWKRYDDAILFSMRSEDDSTRQARQGISQDATQQRRSISDYDVVWVHRHIHRCNGGDVEFYTLASERMLTEPEPLTDTVFHGLRPYVMGNVVLETHKPMPVSVPKLVEGLQEEANEIVNQRLDNVKLVLNKRWFAKRGKNVDLASLVRNVPGGITLLDDPETDVKEVTWPDVTQSSYEEQNRIDSDFSDLAGNFDPMQVQGQKLGQPSTNTLQMLQGPANLLTEYMLKTFVETFVQPVLRHLVLLEQHYETDSTIMALAGEKAQAFQKFGVNEVTDEMLDHELSVTVNVGMGATDPMMKLARFVSGLNTLQALALKPIPGSDLKEISKEIFGLSGYQDGDRFWVSDPTHTQLATVNMQLMQQLKVLASEKKVKEEKGPVILAKAKMDNETKLIIADKKIDQESRHLLAGHMMEMEKGEADGSRQLQLKDHELQQKNEAERPKEDGAKQGMALMKEMVDTQKALVKAFEGLAEALSHRPKGRKGRATLPSGGVMEFETTEH